MREAVAIIHLRSDVKVGLVVCWQVVDTETGVIIRDYAYSRYNYEIIKSVADVMQQVMTVCREFDLKLVDIQVKRGVTYADRES
ncbi:hypothetical protein [Priestia taiwanensis]|uniref:Uncharacterized protein n=1 Tax=Priestia taiwanensis TaxID=1347902 RepID=A0A917ETP5_9BACI|nr:hypothetical protein [Priestia taiwanensis]MBM7364586.1 hypothetical protein [Priestia taiwanensis]GGE80320.1 hypothetical protein GCM10007140_32330 [Priestia taiwanensis]